MKGRGGEHKPTRDELKNAVTRTVPDVIGPGLKVLFCGINPGLYSGAVGHHFARPGNRFWPALHASGFTPERFSPFEERRLLELGLGLTNLVERTTASAAGLSRDELVAGGRALRGKVRRFKPFVVAILGIQAYRMAFSRRETKLGEQPERLEDAIVWVLPSPSGLNAHYQMAELVQRLKHLKQHVEKARYLCK